MNPMTGADPGTARYVSTRDGGEQLGFAEVLLAGLAADGGLYVPAELPSLPMSWQDAPTRGYAATATDVMWPFVEGTPDLSPTAFRELVEQAYATFEHPDVVPVSELEEGLWLAELWHGPTLAFKDVALQLVGRLFGRELARRGERLTIVGATSGDTGSAAIEALKAVDAVDVFIMHPAGRVSDVQRRQMTTADSPNVHNIAIEGTFDDCQDLVKAMFGHTEFRDAMHLSAVNSINFARVLAQTVYYVTTAAAVQAATGRAVSFTVPTGNFGNIYAGHLARRMGLPVRTLTIASNANDILTRTFETATMTMAGVVPTHSPSMDIQVSSNFERLLWEVLGSNGMAVTELLERFRSTGTAALDRTQFRLLSEGFAAQRADDAETLATIADVHTRHGVLVDPHTAVGIAAARKQGYSNQRPMIVLGTAHPAKFPDAVEEASGVRPPLPPRLADLFDRPEQYEVLPNDLTTVENFVRGRARLARSE